jgi:N-acetylglutamate synthase-like GNAT family acetyltransferase
MTARFQIRRATRTDCEGILECLRLAFAPYESSYTAGAYLDTVPTRESLNQRLREMVIFVAVEDSGKIIGTLACQVVSHDEGHLRGMAVDPTWQGAGVAKQLLGCAESELRDRGCTRVTLDTTEPLNRAIGFYLRNGYRATEKVMDLYGMPLFEYAKHL